VNLTFQPTAPPSGMSNSSAIRSATVRAAILLGCVCPIVPSTPRPSSRHIFGNWVVFPEPVSPATMTTWLSRIASRMSSRRAVIGSSSGYLMTGTAARRAATRCSALATSRAISSSARSLAPAFLILLTPSSLRCNRRWSRGINPESRWRSGSPITHPG
jgi:hypothetical protein